METRTASFTLEEYVFRLQAEALQASQASDLVHTCEQCSKLLIKWTPKSSYSDEIFCKVEGLAQISIAEAAVSDCPLFARLLPHCDWNSWLEQGSWEFYFHIGPIIPYIESKDQAVDQVDKGGFQAWVRVLDANGDVHEDLSPKYNLSLDKGADSPFWLTRSPMWRTSAASDDTFARAKGWLEDCLHSATHEHCGPVPHSFVPSRLIKIPREEGSSSIEIIQTTAFVPWCALSYCWGGPQASQTTTSNFQLGVRTLQLSEIPKTILDTIVVASKMSVPYLWVDSLCILQDDPEDLKRELAYMPKIYKHSVVTFIASTSSSSHQGFLHARDFDHHWNTAPVRLQYEDDHGERTTIILHDLSDDNPREPINYRAWALQERLLSPRALIFGSSMLAWNCLSHNRHESALMPRENKQVSDLLKYANHITTKNDMWNGAHSCWVAILTQYSQRMLSFADDRLIAIAAVAEEFGVSNQWDYAAGLWRQDIRESSAWFYNSHIENRRPKTYRAPSWSWPSIDSEHGLQFRSHYFPDIIDVITEPATQELPYGNTKSGHMTVNGRVISIHLQRGRERKDYTGVVLSVDQGTSYRIYLDAPEDDLDGWHECREWKVYLMTLGSRQNYGSCGFPALILKPVSSTKNQYQRVGILFGNIRSEVFQILQRAEQKKFTIV